MSPDGGEPGAIEVSIIILNWNKSALTLNCVESVKRYTRTRYEIIVVDNGSDPLELAAIKAGLDQQVRLISLSRNMFFGEGNNIAVEAAHGKFVLFLNNDVTIGSDVTSALIRDFAKCFSAGAIGPKFLYSNGVTQEAGGFLLPNGLSLGGGQLGQKIDPHFWRGCHIVDYCSAACLLVERRVFMKIGGFDPLFDPAYYEDCDLCLRLRSIGLYTYFASETEVVHEKNMTSGDLWGRDKIGRIVEANHIKFLDRWGYYLENRINGRAQLSDPLPAAASSVCNQTKENRLQILFQSQRILELSPSCRGLFSAAAALQNNFEITIALPEVCSSLRVSLLCRHFGVQLNDVKLVRLSELGDRSYDYVFSLSNAEPADSGRESEELMKSIYNLIDHKSLAKDI